jgi:hypothetical protein
MALHVFDRAISGLRPQPDTDRGDHPSGEGCSGRLSSGLGRQRFRHHIPQSILDDLQPHSLLKTRH